MKSRKGRMALVLALAVGAVCAMAPAEQGEPDTPDVMEIVRKANQVAYYQGGTGRARVNMTVTNAKGNVTAERELVILRRNVGDNLNQKLYAYFERPADVRGTVFLVWKNAEKDDDRWLYNPGLDLVNRIAATDKRTSFVGTHFFYEDVSGRSINDDEHELLRTTENYYVLRNTPKNPDLVEFSYYEMYIHRDTFMPLHAYYYDANGEKYREYHVLGWDQIQDYWTVTRAQMIDLREQGPEKAQTVAEYSDIEYGIELPEDIFTERYLRQPPREHLR
ncbi:MAG: outer membrane lipoprotein-sorting protein [Candidatus Brocadiia bacterium]